MSDNQGYPPLDIHSVAATFRENKMLKTELNAMGAYISAMHKKVEGLEAQIRTLTAESERYKNNEAWAPRLSAKP